MTKNKTILISIAIIYIKSMRYKELYFNWLFSISLWLYVFRKYQFFLFFWFASLTMHNYLGDFGSVHLLNQVPYQWTSVQLQIDKNIKQFKYVKQMELKS